MLTRIYGTAFFSKKDLDAHLERLEQARARDHRRLGRELGLFHFSEVAPGLPFWLPKGMAIWNALDELWRARERASAATREVQARRSSTTTSSGRPSGHWDKYRENMYFTEVEDAPSSASSR